MRCICSFDPPIPRFKGTHVHPEPAGQRPGSPRPGAGSVITRDKGIKLLGVVASRSPRYRKALLPWLLAHLQTCRSQEVPQHAESIAIAVSPAMRAEFVAVLEQRLDGMRPSRAARVR